MHRRDGQRVDNAARIQPCHLTHIIRLLAPADLPSTTIWVGDVAKVSITAGLLDNILVTGACKLITTDFPTNTCNACPSDCAAAGMVGSSNTTPRAAIENLSCPSAKFLIFEVGESSSLEFLHRTLCTLDHF